MDVVWFLLIGLAAGWLAGQLMKSDNSSLVVDLVLGVLGAVVGGYLLRLVGFYPNNLIASLVSATLGAAVLIGVLRAIKK